MKPSLKHFFHLLSLALLSMASQLSAQQTTAFTYQGQLRDGGTNANGNYTMTFKLYDAVTNGNQIGSAMVNSPTLANGLFTVNLDFGNVFNGNARWLDITAQYAANTPETLTPRVQVLPTPYAQFAAVAGTVTNGGIMNGQIADGAVTAVKISGTVASAASLANGIWNAGVTNVSGDSIFYIAQNNTPTSAGLVLHSNGQIARIANGIGIGNNSGEITSDGNGGLNIYDGNSVLSVDNIGIRGGNGNPRCYHRQRRFN
jgi:hypothetical protein